jgi:hypothetical protein
MMAREKLPALPRRPAPRVPRALARTGAPADAGHGCACGGTCPKCRGSDAAQDHHRIQVSRAAARDNGGGAGSGGGGGGGSGGGCASTKTVNIDFVKLRGSNRNPTADLRFANTVFAPACVQFSSTGVNNATRAQSDGWLGGDRDLESGVCPSTAEETATYSGAIADFSLGSRLKAFYVRSISTGDRGNSHPAFCASAGAAADTINVTNDGRRRTLAHEIGHVLMNSADHPADTGNLMHPTNTSTGENLTAAQRASVFAGA